MIVRLGIGLALLAAVTAPLLAQATVRPRERPARVAVPYDGPEIFARLLDHEGIRPIEDVADFASAPGETILIVFGDPRPLHAVFHRDQALLRSLTEFQRRGGALLLATDRPLDLDFAGLPGWRDARVVAGDFVNYFQNYLDQPQCPVLFQKEFLKPRHPIFADIQQPIATNCPGCVSSDNDAVETLAVLPLGTMPGSRNLAQSIVAEILPLPRRLIVTGPAEAGRTLVIAGHGLFTNCMTARDDIDNRRLALNVIRWLKQEKRTRALFFHEGRIVGDFQLPLAGPPKIPPPTLDLVNRLLDEFQKSDALQRLLERFPGRDNVLRGLLILGTFGLVVYGAKKHIDRRRSVPAAAAVVGVPPAAPMPIADRQARELVLRDQLGEPAQALARDWFRTYAGVEFVPGQTPSPLTFDVHAGLFERRRLIREVEAMWKLATDPSPADVAAKKLRALVARLETLTLSAAAGQIHFPPAV